MDGKKSSISLIISFNHQDLPRPERPTNLRSLNLATWFLTMAVEFRSSPQKFSSFPAFICTIVPSDTSESKITLNETGSVLLDLQWLGSAEQTTDGDPVRTNSPGWSFITSLSSLSPGKSTSGDDVPDLEDELDVEVEEDEPLAPLELPPPVLPFRSLHPPLPPPPPGPCESLSRVILVSSIKWPCLCSLHEGQLQQIALSVSLLLRSLSSNKNGDLNATASIVSLCLSLRVQWQLQLALHSHYCTCLRSIAQGNSWFTHFHFDTCTLLLLLLSVRWRNLQVSIGQACVWVCVFAQTGIFGEDKLFKTHIVSRCHRYVDIWCLKLSLRGPEGGGWKTSGDKWNTCTWREE